MVHRHVPFRAAPLAVILAAAVAAWLLGPAWSARVGPVPWLIALVFVGLPHGAADLAVTRRLRNWQTTALLFTLYAALMVVVFSAFVFQPRPMVVLFAALSCWHFGLSHAHGQTPRLPAAWSWQAVAAVARGAGVLGVPLAFWPAATSAHIAQLFTLAARPGTAAAAPFEPAAIRAVGICLSVAAAAALVVEAVASRRRPAALRRSRETLVDLAVIGGLGVAADPLLAIGVYFLCWHAWREMRPLVRVIGCGRPAAPVQTAGSARFASRVAAVHVAALPLLIPTWAALAAVWWLTSPVHSAVDLAILSLAVYLVVTPSHEALGDFLAADSASGHWTPPSTAALSPPSFRPVATSCNARSASS